jgi:hypothetical protein
MGASAFLCLLFFDPKDISIKLTHKKRPVNGPFFMGKFDNHSTMIPAYPTT